MRVNCTKAAVVIALVLLWSYPASAEGIFLSNYSATTQFGAANLTGPQTLSTMSIAFDGTGYWAVAGGNIDPDTKLPTAATNLAHYDANGNLLSTYTTSLDFRTMFTDGSGNILAHTFNDPDILDSYVGGTFLGAYKGDVIYRMNPDTPGGPSFDPFLSGLALPGTEPGASVGMNTDHTEYISLAGSYNSSDYRVDRWNAATGDYLGIGSVVTLGGFGSELYEDAYPQNRSIASAGGYYLTYNSGILSAWDLTGTRVGTTTLDGAGGSLDSNFSLSYANGMVWINDINGGQWRGYDVGLGGGTAPSPVPEPGSILLLASGLLSMAGLRRKLLG